MDKKLSVGLIGIGNMGSAHASVIGSGQIAALRLASVCDIDAERLKLCLQKNPGVRGYSDWKELVRDPEVDAVIVAVGAHDLLLPIPGVDGANVISAVEALEHPEKVTGKVAVIGGGEVGVETGMYLAQLGHESVVIGRRNEIAGDCTFIHYRSMFKAAWEATEGLSFVLGAEVREIGECYVVYADKETGELHRLEADTVILAVGMRARKDEALSYYGTAPHFYMIGDCVNPGTIQTTTRSAYSVAVTI